MLSNTRKALKKLQWCDSVGRYCNQPDYTFCETCERIEEKHRREEDERHINEDLERMKEEQK